MAYLIHILILFSVYVILGLSLNLLVGYTGLISITHAAFSAMGAYAVAILMLTHGWGFFPAVLMGMVVSAMVATLIAWTLSRLSWDYYVLGSISFNYIVYVVMLNWNDLTRGAMGMPGIPRPTVGSLTLINNGSFLVFALLTAAITYLIVYYITESSFGRVLKAIREDEQAIQVFGYHTTRYKVTVFAIAAVLASVGGSIMGSYLQFIDPSGANVMDSIFTISIVILGGLANLGGTVAGAAVLIVFPELVRFIGFSEEIAAQMRQLLYGLLLVILMRFRPQGLVGKYKL